MDPATSWGIHIRATLRAREDDSDKENQNPRQVSESQDEGVPLVPRRTRRGRRAGVGAAKESPCFPDYRGGGVPADQQRARDKADAPDGFELNIPPRFINFRMTENGHITVAKYIHVMPGNNPIVYGCMKKGGEIQQGEVHAAPDLDAVDNDRHYTHDQLRYLRQDYR